MTIRPSLLSVLFACVFWLGCEKTTSELTPQTSSVLQNSCEGFESSTFGLIVPTTQTTFGTSFYTTANGISFRAVYDDPLLQGFDGSVIIDDHVLAGYTGSNGASNFAGNIFYQGFAITEIDVSAVSGSNKTISFDINYHPGTVNPFNVNGAGLNTLPIGVTVVITDLTFGHHIEMQGPISTFELNGHEVAIDNLCITETDPNACAVCFTDHLEMDASVQGGEFVSFSDFVDSTNVSYPADAFLSGNVKTSHGYYGSDPVVLELNFNALPHQLDAQRISFTHAHGLTINPTGTLSVNFINIQLPGTPLLVVPVYGLNNALSAYGYSVQHYSYPTTIEGNSNPATADSVVIEGPDISVIKLGLPLYQAELRNVCIY